MMTQQETYLKTKLPAMPPMPPNATRVALQKARFHWPRMLLACQLIMCGMLELAPAQVKKTPAYCAGMPGAQPIMARPMMVTSALAAMIGPRMWYLSATHAVLNMTIPAKASMSPVSKGVRLVGTRSVLPARRCLTMGVLTWRSHETLRLTNGETHAAVQNLWEEVRERIRDGCQTTEAHGETPDLEVEARLEEFDEVERFGGNIGSVSIDAGHDEVYLALVEEAPSLLGAGVGEGNQEAVTHETDADGEDTFDDEDPA